MWIVRLPRSLPSSLISRRASCGWTVRRGGERGWVSGEEGGAWGGGGRREPRREAREAARRALSAAMRASISTRSALTAAISAAGGNRQGGRRRASALRGTNLLRLRARAGGGVEVRRRLPGAPSIPDSLSLR